MKQKTKHAKSNKARKGSALLLTTVLLFIILGIVVSLTYVTVMEQKMSSKTKSSVGAFYSAESGIEWALNKIANSSGTISSAFTLQPDSSVNCPASFGTDTCRVFLLDKDGKVITNSNADLSLVKAVRSVGSQGGDTQRAIEAAVAGSSDIKVAVIADKKSQGTNGGSSVAGSWQTRDLNTEISDSDNIVTLSSNQFTLQAGTYLLEASAPAAVVHQSKIRLKNMTDGTTYPGTSEYANDLFRSQVRSIVNASFAISSPKSFEIQMMNNEAMGSYGLGMASNMDEEIYTIVEIIKIK